MTQITLPNDNATAVNGQPNDFQDVLDNDVAIRDVVNGNLDNSNIAATANIAGSKLANLSVPADKLENGAVTNSKLADNSVSTEKVQDSAITTAKLADDSVTPAKLDLDVIDLEQTVTIGSTNKVLLSTTPAAGTYLAFVGAYATSTSSELATGFVALYTNYSGAASLKRQTIFSAAQARSVFVPPKVITVDGNDTVDAVFLKFGSLNNWDIQAAMTLLRIG